jgi:hypothetical protein
LSNAFKEMHHREVSKKQSDSNGIQHRLYGESKTNQYIIPQQFCPKQVQEGNLHLQGRRYQAIRTHMPHRYGNNHLCNHHDDEGLPADSSKWLKYCLDHDLVDLEIDEKYVFMKFGLTEGEEELKDDVFLHDPFNLPHPGSGITHPAQFPLSCSCFYLLRYCYPL